MRAVSTFALMAFLAYNVIAAPVPMDGDLPTASGPDAITHHHGHYGHGHGHHQGHAHALQQHNGPVDSQTPPASPDAPVLNSRQLSKPSDQVPGDGDLQTGANQPPKPHHRHHRHRHGHGHAHHLQEHNGPVAPTPAGASNSPVDSPPASPDAPALNRRALGLSDRLVHKVGAMVVSKIQSSTAMAPGPGGMGQHESQYAPY